MLDFMMISTKAEKDGSLVVRPKFLVKKSKDLMIRGSDFYAIWVEERGLWSTEEDDALELIDKELSEFKKEKEKTFAGVIQVQYIRDAETGIIDKWHRYCQKQVRDNFHALDEHITFLDDPVKKTDYSSKRLSYPLVPCETPGYEKLISTLYSPSERRKIEWAIGAIVTGDSTKLQKFEVLYGAQGTGKSTILNIIQQLFEGYYSVFDAKALGSSTNSFALEAFSSNPLIAIQHDGDLSRIEDNTRLNSLVSHELMTVNEKYRSTYPNRFKCFLFMGTNKPVKITDAKSGLIRRLIDVTPSGEKVPSGEYKKCMAQIPFELGGIACRCKDVYLEDPTIYDDYIPVAMMGASNDFYNFVLDSYYIFKSEDGTTATAAWEMYKSYNEEARVQFTYSNRIFKEELKNYFKEYYDEFDDGIGKIRSFYKGFRVDKFDVHSIPQKKKEVVSTWLDFKEQPSLLDDILKDCPAQYASKGETPLKKWDEVSTTLKDLDTARLHYVKVPENHIVIDFDICDKDGNKSFEENLKEASKWPRTYAELSKSGKGIHLHYLYSGDVSKLSRVYDEKIEVKVFTGNSSLRRKLSKCNDALISTIHSGLPLKGEDKMIDWDGIQNEKMLRTMIKKNLNREYHANTKPSIDYIYDLLDDAYNRGIPYDVSDMRSSIIAFAAQSSHQADYCLKLIDKMKFKSDEPAEQKEAKTDILVFFDCEVFPNLFLVNWKIRGKGKKVVRMINPKPKEIEELLQYRLIGFNNRRYDNHMLYARLLGYSEKQIYDLSKKIINVPKGEGTRYMFREAYNLSYTDVYDFCSKQQSLKKWEIELGIHHKELGLPWDQPVPEERWEEVAAYCDNDVLATEEVFEKRQADFVARQIQVELVKALHGITNVSVNNTTNELSRLIIFGKNRAPQSEFNYRDLSKPVGADQYNEYRRKFGPDYRFRVFDEKGLPTYEDYDPDKPLPKGYSILPFFPNYIFDRGKSIFVDDLALKDEAFTILASKDDERKKFIEEIGEGGRVYSEPGMYWNVWDGDIASQHPHSIMAEVLFGPKYTKTFSDIVEARVAVKHKDFAKAGALLGGVLKPFLNEEQAKDLAQALKIIINSIYGLTSASFPNSFRDPSNIDNIVAKRGALFMTLLKLEVQKRNFRVCHIKTDSIKIPEATEEIMDFVIRFGKEFGYDFETEAQYVKYCLVNNAVYIAKDEKGKWTAVGAQFQIPYVFKTLFSKEPIEFEDMCETKSVSSALYLDMNEDLPDVTGLEKEKDKLEKKYKDYDSGPNGEIDYPLDIWKQIEELQKEIEKGHNYIFVGRVGSFCPVVPGAGGGLLMRQTENKKTGEKGFAYAVGTTGFRWMESEMVKELGKESSIDRSYYDNLVNEAVTTISQYGDFEWFTGGD